MTRKHNMSYNALLLTLLSPLMPPELITECPPVPNLLPPHTPPCQRWAIRHFGRHMPVLSISALWWWWGSDCIKKKVDTERRLLMHTSYTEFPDTFSPLNFPKFFSWRKHAVMAGMARGRSQPPNPSPLLMGGWPHTHCRAVKANPMFTLCKVLGAFGKRLSLF